MDVRPGAPYNQRINHLEVNYPVPLNPKNAPIDLPTEASLPGFSLNLRDLFGLEVGQIQ